MVGTLLLSRAVDDLKISDALLEATRILALPSPDFIRVHTGFFVDISFETNYDDYHKLEG